MLVGDAPDPAGQGGVLYDIAGYLIGEGQSFANGATMDVGSLHLVARHADGAPLVRLEPVGRNG